MQHSRYQIVAHKRALQLNGLDAVEAQNKHNERQAALHVIENNIHGDDSQPASVKRKELDDESQDRLSDEDHEAKKLFCLYDVVADSPGSIADKVCLKQTKKYV